MINAYDRFAHRDKLLLNSYAQVDIAPAEIITLYHSRGCFWHLYEVGG